MKRIKSLLVAALFAVTFMSGATVAQASLSGPLGVDFTISGDLLTKDGVGNDINIIGWQFHVDKSFSIKGLGYFDYLGTSLTGSHEVALYTTSGDKVASVVVTPNDTLLGNGSWRFHSIAETALLAGQDYIIAATVGNDRYTFDPVDPIWHSGISFVKDVFDADNQSLPASWVSTASADVAGGFGPNFVATPIPAAVYLLGSGLLGLAGIRRKMNS